jgi:hypothetical protein
MKRLIAASGALLATFGAVWSIATAAYPHSAVDHPLAPNAGAPATCRPG